MFSSFSNLTQALVNFFIFLPYYFSVDVLLGTLFAPWKRIVARRASRGFSFSEWGTDLSTDLVSRGVGFAIRSATLVTFLMVQMAYLPFALILLIAYSTFIFPIQFVVQTFSPNEDEHKTRARAHFLDTHMLDVSNRTIVERWFETWHSHRAHAQRFWELDNLFNTIPIGRDWTHGFTPTLDRFATDLTGIASRHDARPMTIGRESELREMERVLCKTSGSNILLIGEEGVGKRTVIESLAYRIHIGRGNPLLAFKRLIEINLERLLAEATDAKIRESTLETLFAEAESAGNIIFVIADVDRYISTESGKVDLSIPLIKYAQSNKIQLIATTTPSTYQKYVYPHDALRTLFTSITVNEVSLDVTLAILLDHAHRYEARYGVVVPYETIAAAVQKSAFFINDIPFPEKALQVVDDACVKTQNAHHDNSMTLNVVMPDTIDAVISTRTHIPTTLTDAFKQKLLTISDTISTQVIGQIQASKKLAGALQRSFIMLGKRQKPLASFLFLGPTGVGKTETAKILAREFFESEEHLIRFDMSEFQRVEDIARLIGDETTGEPGQLVAQLREKPYGVLLLDEIEKAHPNLLNIFLTLLDEGYITDATGKKVDVKTIVVIATSNAGAREFYADLTQTSDPKQNVGQGDIMDFLIVNNYFSPEFLNRFDGVIAFEPLTGLNAYAIAKKMITASAAKIESLHQVKVVVKEQTVQRILTDKFRPAYGARDLDRSIAQEIETVVAQKMLTGTLAPGTVIEV